MQLPVQHIHASLLEWDFWLSSRRGKPTLKTIPAVLLSLTLCAVAVGQTTNHNAAEASVIKGSGCVEKAVETGCQVLIDAKTGDTYNLHFSAKVPKPGTAIRFKGTAHQGMTTCMQGKPVNVTSWKKEKGIKCPPPSKPAH
jgi:hypothetical protein